MCSPVDASQQSHTHTRSLTSDRYGAKTCIAALLYSAFALFNFSLSFIPIFALSTLFSRSLHTNTVDFHKPQTRTDGITPTIYIGFSNYAYLPLMLLISFDSMESYGME